MSERSKVAFANIREHSSVQTSVSRAMRLVDWTDTVSSGSFFLKVNLLSKEVIPGQCTSPWVFEGVLREIRRFYPGAALFYGDSDVATMRQLNQAVRSWGFTEIARRYEAEFVNLSECRSHKRSFGKIFSHIPIPEVLLEAENIITIPVVKTHCLTPFTAALKNQWGLLPRVRFKYHPVVHEAIAEINGFFKNKIKCGVADLTIAMEGPGPRVGYPKVCNAVMASNDVVALDSAIAHYMGFEPEQVPFLVYGENEGVGSMAFEMVGDAFSPSPFKPGKGEDYFIYKWRDRISKVPGLGRFILGFSLPFRFFGHVAALYYRYYWYPRTGRQHVERALSDPMYRRQFEHLIGR